jgi:hypothetical protein
MLQLMFFWLKASLAAPKMATSSAPAANARSKPCRTTGSSVRLGKSGMTIDYASSCR